MRQRGVGGEQRRKKMREGGRETEVGRRKNSGKKVAESEMAKARNLCAEEKRMKGSDERGEGKL